MWKYILLALMMIAVAGSAMVRVRPIDPVNYHVEDIGPLMTAGQDGQFNVGEGGDVPAVETPLAMDVIGPAMADLIDDTPRTTLLAGSLTSGDADKRVATYVTRTMVFGFPDITNVMLETTENGTRVTMHAEQVYGVKDFGVNEKRVRAWLDRLNP